MRVFVQPRVGEQWDSRLMVAVPIAVLRQQLRQAFVAVVQNEPSAFADDIVVGSIAFSLSVAIHFKLNKPRPTNSPIYFTTHSIRVGDSLTEVPLLVTVQRVRMYTYINTHIYKHVNFPHVHTKHCASEQK